jgi:hypothetical protein
VSRDPKLDRKRRKAKRLRRELHDDRGDRRKVSRLQKKLAFVRLRIAKVVARRKDLTKVAILDGTPVTLEQKIALLLARKEGWDGTATSGDRRTTIARLLRRLGKKSQAELFQLFQEGKGAPANPPTQGTHLRLGDGVIGDPGVPIPAWQQGLDASFATQLRSILVGQGFDVRQTYSTEEWHSNFMAPIKPVLVRKGLV